MTFITRRPNTAFADFAPSAQVFEDAFNRFFNEPAAARPWTPAVDIAETENELVLTADIPGVKLEEIDIRLEDGNLVLKGTRKFENQEKKGGYHRLERSYGTFQRVFTLPESVDAEKVNAAYENGVLKVVLPKKEIAKPKQIKVEVAAH